MNSLKRFNETVIDVMRELQNMLHDNDFRFYKQTAKTLILVNKSIMYSIFSEHIDNHTPKILNKDESLFRLSEFTYLIKNQFYEKVIQKCEQAWQLLNAKQKELIWLYLQVLVLFHQQIQMI